MNEQPADLSDPTSPDSGKSSRTPIIVGVGVVVAAVLGGGAYAASQLLGAGPQAAEALPDSVVAYASIDIDPGAKQKIEAVRTLRKFPDLRDELKLKEKDDLRKRLFDEMVKGTDCEGEVSFDKDIEPWLGDKAAFAAADLGGDTPSPVMALQITDRGDAEKGVKKLNGCGESPTEDTSFAYTDDYLIVSDGEDNAEKIVKDAAKGSLADDKSFTDWTDKAGGDGIISFYVSEKAAELLKDSLPPEVAGQSADVDKAIAEFKGMAGALRFADAGLEIEVAAEGGDEFVGDAELGGPLGELPKDTAIALGIGVPKDFAASVIDQLGSAFGGQADSMVAEIEAQTGLDVPDDIQTLLGDAVLVALGGDAPEKIQDTSGPTDIPFGLKILGDADKIKAVVAKAEERSGTSLADSGIVQDNEGDAFVLASNEDFAETLKTKGSLGDNENFTAVVPEADKSSFALFIDFDSAWRDTVINSIKASGGGPADEVDRNTEPLGALGISGWRDGKVSHGLIKITTD